MRTYKIPRIKLSYVADVNGATQNVMKSSDSAEILKNSFDDGDIDYREFFKVMYLNRSNKVIGIHDISMGGTTSTSVDVKMIFSGALLSNAQGIILCHNHPSGNLCPSMQDDGLTRKIKEAGKLLDISVLDHIILSRSGYYSYADVGRI